MAKQVSMTNTKKEILQAYNELLKKESSRSESPEKEQKRDTADKIITETGSLSVESIIKNVSGLKTNINGSLDKIEEQMVEAFRQFKKLQEAIGFQKEKLEEMYQITAETHSLAALIEANREKKEMFEQEMNAVRNTFENDKIQTEAEIKEMKAQVDKDRKREEEEYHYELKLKRKKEQDDYDERKNKLEKELKDKQIAFDRQIAEREAAVKDAESELADLREKDKAFPELLEAEIKKAVKETEGRLQQQFRYEKELTTSNTKAEIKLKDQTIEMLNAKIEDQQTLINQLSQKAVTSEESVKQIALKALEPSFREKSGYQDKIHERGLNKDGNSEK